MSTSNGKNKVKRRPRVAFQGEMGSYSEEAIEKLWRKEAFPVPAWDFAGVMRAVESGKVDYGVIPVENSVIGRIHASCDLLESREDLTVVDEIEIQIHHCLLAIPGATLKTLRTVASHPAALKQCSHFLSSHPALTIKESYDTAGAAREVAAHITYAESAIASPRAAARYGLEVLESLIGNSIDNRTRFLVIRGSLKEGFRDHSSNRSLKPSLREPGMAPRPLDANLPAPQLSQHDTEPILRKASPQDMGLQRLHSSSRTPHGTVRG